MFTQIELPKSYGKSSESTPLTPKLFYMDEQKKYDGEVDLKTKKLVT